MSTMQLRILDESEILKLHSKTLEVFETVGIKITHDSALQKLKKAGDILEPTPGYIRRN